MKRIMVGYDYWNRREKRELFSAVLWESLFVGAYLLAIWYKFHSFDVSLSQRHALSFVTFAGNFSVPLCLSVLPLLLPGRLRRFSLLLLNLALSLLLLTDVLYMRYYADLFTLRNLGLSAQAGEISDSIAALLRPSDIKYFIDIPLFALFSCLLTRGNAWTRPSFLRSAVLGVLFAAGIGGVLWKIADYNRTVPGALKSLWDRPAVAIGTGTLVYHVADVRNIVQERLSRRKLDAGEIQTISDWLSSREADREKTNRESRTFGTMRGKNLIVIQVESLQNFVVGLSLGGKEVTPNINHLCGESLYFPLAYNQTASGNSCDSEFMVNTSLYPTANGVAFMRFAGHSYHSLGSELKSLGYHTIALHGDRPGFWNRGHMYPALAFDRYISKNEFEKSEAIGLGMSDRAFFEQSMRYLTELRDRGAPFYAFLVTLTSHYPFDFRPLKEQVTDIELGTLEGTLLGNYLRSIRYTDRQLGRFVESLERENLLNSSVLVIYGDHPAIPGGGEALGKLLGRDLSTAASQRTLQSIPIMIRLPRGELAGVRKIPTGQMDIGPTIASLLGFSIPTSFGRDLLDPALHPEEKVVIFRNGSYVKGSVWIRSSSEQAVDLKSGREKEYAGYAQTTSDVAKELGFSDVLLEHNMSFKIKRELPPTSPLAGQSVPKP